jgi:hypothetical protein
MMANQANHTVTRNTVPGCGRWLAVLPLLLAVFQVNMALRALQTPGEIAAQTALPLPLDALASGVWAFFAVWAGWRLLRGRPGGRQVFMLFAGFTLYSVLRLALFTQAGYDRQRLPFLVIAALVAWTVLIFSFLLTQPMRLQSVSGDNV